MARQITMLIQEDPEHLNGTEVARIAQQALMGQPLTYYGEEAKKLYNACLAENEEIRARGQIVDFPFDP